MNFLLFILSIFVLLFALRKVSMIKYSKRHSVFKDVQQNAKSLLWGVLVISAIIFIPYQIWVLTGEPQTFGAVYIIGGTALLTIALSFIFYYKSAVKYN
ncbi:hypothetical protein FZC78_11005 [Rossellomorea vietnamensis]|uniref:Uncharacterized protein n=1 Tax=Rossellomorea vietnamensis TaxID=218284 RepID=A0A5D4NS15_9BACI|nr:hypothetical protein [Rossellomorea vietnamensis]TYS17133.1 hypothetical protein FZC78_11005 [Rossellomorea vietnamensis]